jgi:hypothetical protein
MNNYNGPKQRFTAFVLILIVGAYLVACGAGSEKWKEEVQLSDGRVVVVEREKLYEGGGDEWAANRSLSKPNADRIRFTLDISGQPIEWRTRKISPQTWPETPLVFDIESGKPTVFTLVAISGCCEAYSKYVYQNGVWTEELLPDQFEPHTTNLLYGTLKDLPRLVNLQEKDKRNREIGYRQSLKKVGPNRTVKFD